jgi:hypothetical protein
MALDMGPVGGSCELGNEPPIPTKSLEFSNQIRNY